MNKLCSDTNSITQRLGRVEKLNKYIQIPNATLHESPRTGTSPVKRFKRLISKNTETGNALVEQVIIFIMVYPLMYSDG